MHNRASDTRDELDRVCREMWAQTMRPCRELTRHERAAQREEVAERNLLLTSTERAPIGDVA